MNESSESSPNIVVRKYHETEKRGLDNLVEQGHLSKVGLAGAGMYLLEGEYLMPVAISTGGLVIRSGDRVKFSREAASGPNIEIETTISNFM